MPFEANAERRHPIPKQKRRVTNWAAYDAGLRQRGSLTVWFSAEAIAAWRAAPRTTRSGQAWYSPLAILTALTLRAVFRLALRQIEGVIGSIIDLLGLALAVPDPSTLSRRAQTLVVPRPRSIAAGQPVHRLVDSTGLKLCGAGEWLVEKYGTKIRRSWGKLHIGVDANTGEIMAADLTTNDVDDASQVGSLLDQMGGRMASFTAAGAYDQDRVYRAEADHDPQGVVIVPPRSKAVLSDAIETEPTQRDRHLQSIVEKGRMGWLKASGYNKRVGVGAAIGRYKQVIGVGLRFRKDPRRTTEVAIAIHVLNRCWSWAARTPSASDEIGLGWECCNHAANPCNNATGEALAAHGCHQCAPSVDKSTDGEARDPSGNTEPGCLKVVDTFGARPWG